MFVKRGDAESQAKLHRQAATVEDRGLRDLLMAGIGLHDAGMTRHDRTIVEDLFQVRGHRVMVSRTSKAWQL